MFQCEEDEEKIKQFFGEIFKFYNNKPHLQTVLQLYLVYIMASFQMSMEQIMNLMDSVSPKSKNEIMTTYEILVAKGEGQGIEKGAKLERIKIIWDAHLLKMPIAPIAELSQMAPSRVKKWLTRFESMQQGEADGLTPAEIMQKVNELAEEPVVLEWEVIRLLLFFKERSAPKKKTKRTKKN